LILLNNASNAFALHFPIDTICCLVCIQAGAVTSGFCSREGGKLSILLQKWKGNATSGSRQKYKLQPITKTTL